MSRCFAYPPPDYKGNCTRDAAVIESIKLQREEKKAQTERREEKKVKKERRKEKEEKNEKEKTRRNGEIESQKHGHKKRHKHDMSQNDQKGGNHQNRRKNEVDHFEKSSLTEEHGHPIGSENICYSSDGSLNSNKRQKYSSPPNSRHDTGNIFRIRLPLQRHKDPEVLLPIRGQPCSALGRTHAFVQEMCDPAPKPGSREGEHLCFASGVMGQGLDLKLVKKIPWPSSVAAEIFGQKPEIASAAISAGSDSSLLELRFKDLLDYWVPPQMQSQCLASDNQDWLLETKQNHNLAPQRCETNCGGGSYGNSAPWPRVYYLPEVDIYALPFTVPF